MKLVKKEYVKVLEWAFKIAYLFLGVATFNSFLYDSSVQPFLVNVCLVLGGLTLLGRLVFFRDYWKMPYWILLALFCVAFLLSMIMNREYRPDRNLHLPAPQSPHSPRTDPPAQYTTHKTVP